MGGGSGRVGEDRLILSEDIEGNVQGIRKKENCPYLSSGLYFSSFLRDLTKNILRLDCAYLTFCPALNKYL